LCPLAPHHYGDAYAIRRKEPRVIINVKNANAFRTAAGFVGVFTA
jgi:hypothetical protein